MPNKKPSTQDYQRVLEAYEECGHNKARAAASLNLAASTFKERFDAAIRQSIKPKEKKRWPLPKSQVYLITWAQNATPPKVSFLQALQHCAAHRNAKLLIIPGRYRNPTSQWTANDEAYDWWHEDLVPYLFGSRANINENLMVLADIKIQPTNSQPLSSFTSISGHRSGIIGHPKLAMTTVPTPGHMLPKIMATTGAVTVQNYTDTRAGAAGEFHHTFGAALIEVRDNKIFHYRQINAVRDGSFIDGPWQYSKDGVTVADRALGLHLGDAHIGAMDQEVERATWGPNGVVEALRPREQVWNDTLDFYSASHHHRHNPFTRLAKQKHGINVVRKEVEQAAKFIADHTIGDIKNVIVSSNHDEAFARWVKETDWRNDPDNAEFYLETALQMAKSSHYQVGGDSHYTDPFHFWLKRYLPAPVLKRTVMLGRHDGYDIGGIEVGFHGDEGANGARGSRQQFMRIGRKSIIGHGHAPGISESCYQSGTCAFLMREYIRGLSGHLNAHTAIYANGKRAILIIVGGHWRLDK